MQTPESLLLEEKVARLAVTDEVHWWRLSEGILTTKNTVYCSAEYLVGNDPCVVPFGTSVFTAQNFSLWRPGSGCQSMQKLPSVRRSCASAANVVYLCG
jgi:hypothetical protein